MIAVSDLDALRSALNTLANPKDAVFLQRFFKTGPGEYGEGDRFLGIRVPVVRALVRSSRTLSMAAVLTLLQSPWHEERLLALLLLVDRYRRAEASERETIYHAYLANTAHINNWDLVDTSAEHIVGAHLVPTNIGDLKKLAHSASVWERRIAIMATFHFVKQREFRPTNFIATMLLNDQHDLIHKAVGWMLREVGNRDRATEEVFLQKHYRVMPRTMLRYAIEKFPADRRQAYLRGEV